MARSFFRSVGISLSVLGLGCGVSASVCGCYIDDCSDTLTCGSVCVADPSKEAAKDDCGVFVSSDLGDDANPGTKAKPVKTFERAIALARTGPMRLYACAESFTEPVMLPSGIEVWGGLDCAHDWSYVGDSRSTVIAPEPDTVPLHVKAGEGTSIISDLQLEAADATIPGGSSIAMVALVGSVVDLRRSKLIAGNGAKGAPGERGGEEPAKEGTLGNDGAAACTADSVPGAQPVTTVCGDLTTVGGKGGDGTATSGDKGNDGQPAPDPNPQGLGLGGVGETDAFSCLPGQMGSPGADGAHGLGAQWPGSISPEFGWLGKRGYDGGDGSRGQGGGGGA
ncbi:MAG: hypothetical protein IT372_19325, partial [Polyangiaceae bacterium]|nr:hypothetical protein [Polyangiaceae bacterium]